MKLKTILTIIALTSTTTIFACDLHEWKMTIKNGTIESVTKFIKSNHCEINQELDSLSKTPLVYAIEEKNMGAITAIVNAGGDVNYDGYDGKTPLYYAISSHQINSVKYLISHGADTNSNTRFSGMTLLMFSILEAKPAITAYLVSHGASLNEQDKYGQKPVDYVKKLAAPQRAPMYRALLNQQ
ncbi:ankyrin repeat domain-containing protein [Aquitalea magnusonii]|uniref:ankyrin repeat domain-containing protein n=1 Tax=Aquitalea magnusonii TaxID=332411 RepID=UPI000B5CBB8E|nr:ankyrin repeat domain-containing protein [Aquitalea magnusonii]